MAINQKWSRDDWGADVTPLYGQLVNRGVKILIFSGDTDSVCSTIGTQNWLFDIPYVKVVFPWREWSIDPRASEWQTAGYITKFSGGLTFSTIRNAGHEVPMYRPAEAFHLFSEYLNGSSLFSSEGFDGVTPWSTQVRYGSMTTLINVTLDLHCKSVEPAKFLNPVFQYAFSFMLRAIRHTLESQGLYSHSVRLNAISEAPKASKGIAKSSIRLLATIGVDFYLQYDRISFSAESLSLFYEDSDACPEDVSPFHRAICVGRHVEKNISDYTRILKASEDERLRLKALEVKETVFAVIMTAEKNGFLDSNMHAALVDAMLPAVNGNPAEIPRDFLVKFEDINVLPGVYDLNIMNGPPGPFDEWDALYARIPFLDLITPSPTSGPGLFSNPDSPILVITSEVIVVALVTSAITLCAFLVGLVVWDKFLKSSSSRYSKLRLNTSGFDDNEDHGGEVELASSGSSFSY
jgi:hypothetical protein